MPGRKQFLYNKRAGTLQLLAEIGVGTGGAPTLTSGVGHGFKSVSRTAAGALTVNLDSSYLGLAGFNGSIEGAGNDGYMVKLVEKQVAGIDGINESKGLADGYVNIQVVDDASSAADPVDHTIWLALYVKTSEVG